MAVQQSSYVYHRICGRLVEFNRVPMTGLYAVGVDGRLIGNYNTPEAAVSAALEHVRVVAGLLSFPAVSGLLPAVRDLV